MTDTATPASDKPLRDITTAVYALQAAGFLVGVTFIAAVIINYIKLPDVAGTVYESHFRWQIRTFWWGLGWTVLGALTFVIRRRHAHPRSQRDLGDVPRHQGLARPARKQADGRLRQCTVPTSAGVMG
jgi:hypothetical protein